MIFKGTALSDLFKKKLSEHKNNHSFNITTGNKVVDSIIGGFRYGELIVIGARPSMGKTKYLLKSALEISKSVPVLFYSLESNEKRIMNKLISLKKDGGVTFFIDHIGKYDTYYNFEKHELFVSDKIFDSMEEYLLLLVHHIIKDKVKVIAIDYFQLLPQSNSRLNPLEMLKEICETLEVTIIVSSELSRDCEYREGDKKPKLKDLSIPSSIVHLLDVILLLYRPEYYGFITDEYGDSTTGKLEVIIAKERDNEPFDLSAKCVLFDKEND